MKVSLQRPRKAALHGVQVLICPLDALCPLPHLPAPALIFLPSLMTCISLSLQVCRSSSSPSWRQWCLCFRLGCSSSLPSWCLPSSAWNSTWGSFTKPASLMRQVSLELCCHPSVPRGTQRSHAFHLHFYLIHLHKIPIPILFSCGFSFPIFTELTDFCSPCAPWDGSSCHFNTSSQCCCQSTQGWYKGVQGLLICFTIITES